MERKRSCGYRRIFTVAFDRLGYVNVNDCTTGLEPSAGARNRIKGTVKFRQNPLLRFHSLIQIFFFSSGNLPNGNKLYCTSSGLYNKINIMSIHLLSICLFHTVLYIYLSIKQTKLYLRKKYNKILKINAR